MKTLISSANRGMVMIEDIKLNMKGLDHNLAEKQAGLMAQADGMWINLPILKEVGLDAYEVIEGRQIILAAKKMMRISPMNETVVAIIAKRNKPEQEDLLKKMLELEAGSQQAQKTELTTEERLERIESKLGL
jgi:hypothetical protein